MGPLTFLIFLFLRVFLLNKFESNSKSILLVLCAKITINIFCLVYHFLLTLASCQTHLIHAYFTQSKEIMRNLAQDVEDKSHHFVLCSTSFFILRCLRKRSMGLNVILSKNTYSCVLMHNIKNGMKCKRLNKPLY